MHVTRWFGLGALMVAGALCAVPAARAFDIEYEASPDSLKSLKIERTGPGEDYQDHEALFLRVIPLKGTRVYPVFINTHNYLTCPDKPDKKYLVYQVSEADFHKRSGVKILAFFFEKADCDNPKFHLDAVVADT